MYTCMHVLEANKVQRDRQGRGVQLGGGVRGLPCRGGGVCEYEINEKRGGSVHLCGTVLDIGGMDGEKRRGEVYMCLW